MERLKDNLLEDKEIPLAQGLSKVFDRISELSALDGDIPGLSTGFTELDNMIGGMEAGDLIAVKGAAYTGVTSLLTNIALRTAKATERPVLFFSRGDSVIQLSRRILSSESQVPVERIEKGKLSNLEMQKLMIAVAGLGVADIRFFDKARTVSDIVRCCEEVSCPSVIIVERLPDEDMEPVSQVYRLKQMARKMQVPVLYSCWFRDMSDYTLSGTDKVLRLERKAAWAPFYDQSKAICRVERNPNGSSGEIELYWDDKILTFFPVDHTQGRDIPMESEDV